MNKKVIALLSIIGATLIGTMLFASSKAASTDPGSINDPLVTKGYVDKRLSDLEQKLNQMTSGGTPTGGTPTGSTSGNIDIAELVNSLQKYTDTKFVEFEAKITQLINTKISSGGGQATTASNFTPVEVKNGKRLVGYEGTELILRAGSAVAIANSSGDGLTDVSRGVDLKTGDKIMQNHLLIVPRSDKRGFVAQTDTWVLVKGKCDIE